MNSKTLKKILYVEDEEDICAIAKISLEDIVNFEVKFCNSGKEALDIAPVFLPDLILLDVMMPNMDGETTLKNLRKIPALKNIPVMFVTAKIQPEEINHYLELGAINVIMKPFDPLTLADLIKTSWDNQ